MKKILTIVGILMICMGGRFAYMTSTQAANITYSASDFYRLIWRTEKAIGQSRNPVLSRSVTLKKLQSTAKGLPGSKRMLYADAAASTKNQTYAPYGAFCLSTDGSLLAEGESAIYYNQSAGSCASQARTCINWYLNGNTSYSYTSCTKTCNLPWGGTIKAGESVTAYSASLSTTQCLSQPRYCDANGTLNGTYQYKQCTLQKSCTTPFGTTVPHGTSVTAYNKSTVTPAQSCNNYKQTKTCTNGSLGFSTGYIYGSCSTQQAACTTPRGASVAHGTTVIAYTTQLTTTGVACTSVQQSRTCNNGSLGFSPGFIYASCSTPQPSCTTPWGTTVPAGSNVTAYSSATPATGVSCSSIQQTKTCTNGSLGFGATYIYPSCTAQLAACTTPWGASVPHGTVVTAYNATYLSPGLSCNNFKTTATCNNGTITFPVGYVYGSCTVQP